TITPERDGRRIETRGLGDLLCSEVGVQARASEVFRSVLRRRAADRTLVVLRARAMCGRDRYPQESDRSEAMAQHASRFEVITGLIGFGPRSVRARSAPPEGRLGRRTRTADHCRTSTYQGRRRCGSAKEASIASPRASWRRGSSTRSLRLEAGPNHFV